MWSLKRSERASCSLDDMLAKSLTYGMTTLGALAYKSWVEVLYPHMLTETWACFNRSGRSGR